MTIVLGKGEGIAGGGRGGRKGWEVGLVFRLIVVGGVSLKLNKTIYENCYLGEKGKRKKVLL